MFNLHLRHEIHREAVTLVSQLDCNDMMKQVHGDSVEPQTQRLADQSSASLKVKGQNLCICSDQTLLFIIHSTVNN